MRRSCPKVAVVVASPLQALNALEAIVWLGECPANCALAIPLTPNERNNAQLMDIVRQEQWGELVVIPPYARTPSGWFARLHQMRGIARSFKCCEALIVGDLSDDIVDFINTASAGRVVLVDDGCATLSRASARSSVACVQPQRQGWTRTCKQYLIGMKLKEPESVVFFTIYPVAVCERDTIVGNAYNRLRAFAADSKVTDWVALLGSDLVEAGFVAEELYIRYCRQIRKYLGPGHVVYFPHRREEDRKLRKVAAAGDYCIVESKEPIETRMLRERSLPRVIAGFFTTAFDTLAVLLGDRVELLSFELPTADVTVEQKDAILRIYEYYRNEQPRVQVVNERVWARHSEDGAI